MKYGLATGRLDVMSLSDRERAVLDFERSWWTMIDSETIKSGPEKRTPVTKEECIRQRLALSPARYYQLLNQLVQEEEAAKYDPLVVHRVRRRRNGLRRRQYEGPPARGRRMR